jgi:hypothetical protein
LSSSFVVRAALSEAGSAIRANEDAWGAAFNSAWVIDGATGVEKDWICLGKSDAAWFADRMSAHLKPASQRAGNVVEAMDLALAGVREALTSSGACWPAASRGPTASIAMVSGRGEKFELGILGDCKVIELRRDLQVVSHGSSRISQLDRDLIKKVYQIRGSTDLSEPQKAIKIAELEAELRGLANQKDGYWILDLMGAALSFTEVVEIPASEVAALILVSDGAYRLVDTFLEYDDKSFVMDVLGRGPAWITERLRTAERNDPHCERFWRIKPQDDATLVVLTSEGAGNG